MRATERLSSKASDKVTSVNHATRKTLARGQESIQGGEICKLRGTTTSQLHTTTIDPENTIQALGRRPRLEPHSCHLSKAPGALLKLAPTCIAYIWDSLKHGHVSSKHVEEQFGTKPLPKSMLSQDACRCRPLAMLAHGHGSDMSKIRDLGELGAEVCVQQLLCQAAAGTW